MRHAAATVRQTGICVPFRVLFAAEPTVRVHPLQWRVCCEPILPLGNALTPILTSTQVLAREVTPELVKALTP